MTLSSYTVAFETVNVYFSSILKATSACINFFNLGVAFDLLDLVPYLLWENRAVDLFSPSHPVSRSDDSLSPSVKTHLLPLSFHSPSPGLFRPPSFPLPLVLSGGVRKTKGERQSFFFFFFFL